MQLDERFREEVRAFFSSMTIPRHWDYWEESEAAWRLHREIARALGRKGWLGLTWPASYGGGERSRMDALVFAEEAAYFGNPGINRAGVDLMGPMLLMFGSEEQKARHLPGIASGEVYWAQGFSEPDAGSDLAALRTEARPSEGGFVVNGQKIWISTAHRSQWMFFLARTGARDQRHRTLTLFITPLDAKGLLVRPIRHMAGHEMFCEVFFDEVLVPRSNVVGEVDQGWQIAMAGLAEERSGIAYAGMARRLVDELLDYYRQEVPEPDASRPFMHRLVEAAADAEVSRLLAYQVASLQATGADVTAEAAMSKVFGSELLNRLARLGIDMLGPLGDVDDPRYSALSGRIGKEYMTTLGRITAAGSSEMMRNVIAWRGLGLPR